VNALVGKVPPSSVETQLKEPATDEADRRCRDEGVIVLAITLK